MTAANHIEELRASLSELVAAMRRYEVDVDADAPPAHREMMHRADAVLSATNPTPTDSAYQHQASGLVGSEDAARVAAADYMREAGWCVDYDFICANNTPLSRAMLRFAQQPAKSKASDDLRSLSHAFVHQRLPPAHDERSTRYRAGIQVEVARLLLEAHAALSAQRAKSEQGVRWTDDSDPVGAMAIRLSAAANDAEEQNGEWTWRDVAAEALAPTPVEKEDRHG